MRSLVSRLAAIVALCAAPILPAHAQATTVFQPDELQALLDRACNWNFTFHWSLATPTSAVNVLIDLPNVYPNTLCDSGSGNTGMPTVLVGHPVNYYTGPQLHINRGAVYMYNGTMASGHVSIGGPNNGVAAILLESTSATWLTSDDVGVGNPGNGTLTVAWGATLGVGNNGIFVAYDAGSTGVLNIGDPSGDGGTSPTVILYGAAGKVFFGQGAGTINFYQRDTFTLNYPIQSLSGSTPGNLVQRGTGTTILAVDSPTFAGTTTITSGTLQLGTGGAAGSLPGNITNNSALVFNRSDITVSGGAISGTGSVIKRGSGEIRLTGNNSYGGGTTIEAGVLQFGNGGNTGISPGNVTNNGTFSIARSDDLVYGGVVSGSGSMWKGGANTLSLTGNSSYTGWTIVWEGTLRLGNGGTTGSLASSNIDVKSNATLAFNRSDNVAFGGVILGPGNVSKLGAGSLVLTGANTYTGSTTVTAGTLAVNGSITSNVAVNTGATLAGSGTVGPVTVNSGGFVAPGGTAAAILSTGNFALPNGGTFNADLLGTTAGSGYDRLAVAGTVSLGGNLSVNLGFAPAVGQVFTIIDNGGGSAVSGTFAGRPEGSVLNLANGFLRISYVGGTGNDVTLTAVAVPGAPTIGTATAANASASVTFTAPASNGGSAITSYTATSSPEGKTGTCTAPCSSITVNTLTNGTAYVFAVRATNAAGAGNPSAFSNGVTPKAPQTITFANPGIQSGFAPTLSASASSALAVTFTSSTAAFCTTTAGGTLAILAAGTCTINADQAGNAAYLPAPTVTRSFAVTPAAPSVPTIGVATAGNASATITFSSAGGPITSFTATSSPGGITGTCAAPCASITVNSLTNGTAYTFTVTATNSAGPSAPSAASNSVMPKGPQTITFANPGTQTFGTSPMLTATASSGLTVTFTSTTPGVCSITGTTLNFVTTGSCSIRADQSGSPAYLAATPVTQSFSVARFAPGAPAIVSVTAGNGQVTVSFAPPASDGGSPILDYTATCGTKWVTGGGSPMAVTGLTNGTPVTCTVVARNAIGTGSPSAASGSVTPNQAQTITFTNPGAQNLGTSPTLTAAASSGLAVTFTSSTSGVCTITAGGTLTLVTSGTCTINADQAGNANFAPAPRVTQSFTVSSKISQAIVFGAVPTNVTVGATGTVSATGGASGNPIVFASTTPSTCSVSGSTVTGLAAGTCTISANQAGNATYDPAPQVTQGFTITGKASQSIVFGAAPTNFMIGSTGTVSATGGASGNPIAFASTTPSTCSISGNTVTGLAPGTCTISADQAGNATYDPASQVTQSFDIASPPRMSNISTRMQVLTGDDALIGGFVIAGSTNKRVAIVATGPSLVPFGITNALTNPTLRLVRSSDQAVIATSDNWQTAANQADLTAAGFAPSNPLEAAILIDLAPGAYTAIIEGAGGVTGVSVIGVYEVNHPETPLVNISTRGRVLTGNDVMIGGFVISGAGPQTLAIVATGPSLAAFGIANPLANPRITLVRSSDQAVLATNDNWQADANAAQLNAAGFAPTNPLESGLCVTLPPGAYTVIVEGVNGGTGVAVVGVYRVN